MAVDLQDVAAATLAGSLAMERLVVIFKTMFPWLAEAKVALPGESEIRIDQRRRLSVLAITVIASLITAYFIADSSMGWDRVVVIGGQRLWFPIFGLMISGGSAFWSSIVGFASAAKDVRTQEKLQVNAETIAVDRAVTGTTRAPWP